MNNPTHHNSTGLSRRTLLRSGLGAAGLLLLDGVFGGLGMASAATKSGPTTTAMAYLYPARDGVDVTALLTVRDKPAENGYRMVGIPDGLGIIPDGDKFTLLMNHEIPSATVGGVRKHGSKGAFVSRWSIERSSLRVLTGQDQISAPDKVYSWDAPSRSYKAGTTAYARFCSADLADAAAFLNGTKGTASRLFLNGEEVEGGRAWAHIASGANQGESWELPRFGRQSWENLVASPHSKDKTVVAALDDGNLTTSPVAENFPCELFMYIGTKQETGSDIERAGLTNGKLYGVRLIKSGGYITEESDSYALGETDYVASRRFELVELGTAGDVSGMSQLDIEKDAIAKNVWRPRRTEDAAWDPRATNKGNLYFVTTGSITTNSRLWNLKFDDLDAPDKGGVLTALLKGDEGQRMLDNMAIDSLGRILLQEDPGNDPRLARVWLYGIESKQFLDVAYHNPVLFEPRYAAYTKAFVTQDEESSGIIDASSVLGDGWFLAVVQSHNAIGTTEPELVEDGQLLALYVNPTIGR